MQKLFFINNFCLGPLTGQAQVDQKYSACREFKFNIMLKQTIQSSVNESLKAGDHFLVEVLRMLLAAILTKEKEGRFKVSKAKPGISEADLQKESQLTDEETIDVISSEIKKRKDAISLYNQGNRPELAEKEQKEIDILIKYLPEQLSGEELKKLVSEAITATGAKEMRDMGKVMADLMPKVRGKADSAEISKIVKEILAK